jgi:hypothetical protein
MKLMNVFAYLGIILLALALGSCDKTKPYEIKVPAPLAHFVGDETQTYSVLSTSTPAYKVEVGTTDVSTQDREVSYAVTSSTGAVLGSSYTLNPVGKVIIPAGKATATINVQGNSTMYPAGKKDTLKFTLSEPGIKIASFLSSMKLVVKGPCSEVDVKLTEMGGNYKETDPSGTYTNIKLTNLTATSATTGTGIISNLWGDIAPITINFNWSDVNNITVTIPQQLMGYDYDAGLPFAIRTTPGAKSTFSICNQTISLVVDLLVVDYFGPGTLASYKSSYAMNCKR